MMSERAQPDRRAFDGEQPTAGRPTMVQQAGQLMLDEAVIVVHRTLADEHSPHVVLRTRHGGVVVDVAARPGQEIEVPGAGNLLVVDVRASTQDWRGAVALLRR